MTQIHPRINIGLQYIRNMDEYIPKLQLHQHPDGPPVSTLLQLYDLKLKLLSKFCFDIQYGNI